MESGGLDCKQFLLNQLSPSCYSCYKPGDKSCIRKDPDCYFDQAEHIRCLCKACVELLWLDHLNNYSTDRFFLYNTIQYNTISFKSERSKQLLHRLYEKAKLILIEVIKAISFIFTILRIEGEHECTRRNNLSNIE